MIPGNFFFFWTGQDFQYIHYLCVLSLLKTNSIQRCEIWHEEEPTNNPLWESLHKNPRVTLHRIDYKELFATAGLNPSDYEIFFSKASKVNRSDIFRYLKLFAQGGVYLDLDILVLRDLKPLLNTGFFGCFEARNTVNGAVLGARQACPILKLCLDELLQVANKQVTLDIASAGPRVLSRVFWPKSKRVKIVRRLLEYADKCGLGETVIKYFPGFNRLAAGQLKDCQLYPKVFFYHYHWSEWKKIFADTPLPNSAFLIHFWGGSSSPFTQTIDKNYLKTSDSIYARSIRKILPDELKK